MKKFDPLDISSKFAICGLPIRVDTYRTCSFGCVYCFSNGRTSVGGLKDASELQIGNIDSVKNRLERIFDKKQFDEHFALDNFISKGYTWHCGGMADPFQPCEKEYQITKSLIELTKQYNIHILFSTKTNTLYDSDNIIDPNLHTFQLSITNINNRTDLQPNVADIESRYNLYRSLKDRGFKVGIRIQPFIPNIATLDIVKKFFDADHFIMEGLKLVSNNHEQRNWAYNTLGIPADYFKNYGLLNLKPNIRLELYKPFIDFFEQNHISYSLADNDLHYLGNNKCCCGDALVPKSTDFNSTAISHNFGIDYTKEQVFSCLEGCGDCKVKQSFYSGSQGHNQSIIDFYNSKFDLKTSTFSPKYFYVTDETIKMYKQFNTLHVNETPVILQNLLNNEPEALKEEPPVTIEQNINISPDIISFNTDKVSDTIIIQDPKEINKTSILCDSHNVIIMGDKIIELNLKNFDSIEDIQNILSAISKI